MAEESEKCRKTKIIRVGDEDGWVDLEVLVKATFKGAQWNGPDTGNQTQETIFYLDEDLTGNEGDDVVTVDVDPDKKTKKMVGIHTKSSAKFHTRKADVIVYFANSQKNKCRNQKDKKQRIQFNHIDDEFIRGGKPPEKPKDYKKAVDDTKDTSEIWLDVYVPKVVKVFRNKDLRHQGIDFTEAWGKGMVSLPGSSSNTNPKGPHVRLDPYQAIIEFRP